MLRKIVKINEEKCNGCGECVPNCAEGALQIIDGKARLISDLFCDGLGACIGYCPEDAITIEEREAEPYNEYKVMDYIVKGGKNVIAAHLIHLLDHNEIGYYKEALSYLTDKNIGIPDHEKKSVQGHSCGCGDKPVSIDNSVESMKEEGTRASHLKQWPIQLHLVSPNSGYYRGTDLLLAADCAGFAYPDFHKDFLKDKSIAIACPKLDSNKESYVQKLISMIDDAEINSITVMIMTVPCCGGLLQLVKHALNFTKRVVPIKVVVVGINGEIVKEEAVNNF